MATPPKHARLDPLGSTESEQAFDISDELEQRTDEGFRIWYKSTKQSCIRRIRNLPPYKTFHDESEIIADNGKANITQISIENGIVPRLNVVAPKLKFLEIKGVNHLSNLQSLLMLTDLKELYLSGNDFSGGLPEIIGEIKSLNKLYIDSCQLRDLPRSLSHLHKLKELHMSDNDFSDGLPEAIGEIVSLNRLYLRNCQLTNLPDRLCQLTSLKQLYLSGNDFSPCLPEIIGMMNSLNKLHLFRCKLSSLPESLSQLICLKELQLTSNNFSGGLPPVIGQISNLNILLLSGCKLTDIPDCLTALTKLKELNLSDNNFAAGLPAVIGEISSLTTLSLNRCQLKSLHENLGKLERLHVLRASLNKLDSFPSSVFKMRDLKTVDLSHNSNLETVEDLLHLEKLKLLSCDRCYNLVYPPYAVCQQGLAAVKQYFTDLTLGKQKTVIPVAVIGRSMSGKTSLIKSLQEGKRCLTNRTTVSLQDESTKVFHVKDLQLPGSHLKLIDYGGHEIYHIAYRMMVKEQHLPIIVVNLQDFSRCVQKSNSKQATQDVCFDWLAHLYLACPRLGSPILVFTHVDKLQKDSVASTINMLLEKAEELRKEVLEESKHFSDQQNDSNKILHFHNMQVRLFGSEDIFQFGIETDAANIESFNKYLDKRCQEFNVVIPQLWEEMLEFVSGQTHKPYIAISEIASKYATDRYPVILRYMHNTGDILWFETKDKLCNYIFHKTVAIAELIGILFHHCADEQWKQRLMHFTRFKYGDQWIIKDEYDKLIRTFKRSGVLDKALLMRLLEEESNFPSEVALELLECFCILHGPIEQKPRGAYVIPYFATTSMGEAWKTDGELQLRLDMIFGGLTLPHYVLRLITVTLLNNCCDTRKTIQVTSDGVTVYQGNSATYLVHDFDNRKVTLQISTDVKQLGESWYHLQKLTRHIVSFLSDAWKACYVVLKSYCSHCLFLRDPNPDFYIQRDWCDQESPEEPVSDMQSSQRMRPVTCGRHADTSNSQKPTVPTPLVYPCGQLTDAEIDKLQEYLSGIESGRHSSEPADAIVFRREATQVDENDSDCSDVEIEGYCDHSKAAEMSMRLISVRKERIKRLYDTNKVYRMSGKSRGRVLIINIRMLVRDNQYCGRYGSDIDYCNISTLFKDMHFDIVKSELELTDLTAEEIYQEIKKETEVEAHSTLGMFVLVLMSLGTRGHIILDCQSQPVDIVKVKDLLTPSNFPAMKGKPKLLIIQACSGERMDLGDAAATSEIPSISSSVHSVGALTPASGDNGALTAASGDNGALTPATGANGALTPAAGANGALTPATGANGALTPAAGANGALTPATGAHGALTPATGANGALTPATGGAVEAVKRPMASSTSLNVDDFFIMKPSSESYLAVRSPSHGSWFIRILVATFYKHAHSKNMDSLFKIIQDRVRKVSMTHKENAFGGNVPVCESTLTHMKKLYFFPGYFPKSRPQ